ncbi:hypothetical protein [Thiomonas sp.]
MCHVPEVDGNPEDAEDFDTSPIFPIHVEGPGQISELNRERLRRLCDEIRERVGVTAAGSVRVYRQGEVETITCRFHGDHAVLDVQILAVGHTDLTDVHMAFVPDYLDALYLASILLQAMATGGDFLHLCQTPAMVPLANVG